MQAKKITVTGLVQGVGFRPAVAELAEACQIAGQVKNMGGVVEIIAIGEAEAVEKFFHRLKLLSGKVGRIDTIEVQELAEKNVSAWYETVHETEWKTVCGQSTSHIAKRKTESEKQSFYIVESSTGRENVRLLPVDFSTCDRCRAELFDKKNRRYRYPFISCTACGPRYSIQREVPYDRESITMGDFPMCGKCREEYEQKGNIRRHAQTIACHDCGPTLSLIINQSKPLRAESSEKNLQQKIEIELKNFGRKILHNEKEKQQNAGEIDTEEKRIRTDKIIYEVAEALQNDKIVAIKDIGGFHFACSPKSSEAAVRLREWKHRDRKPFAVMFPDMAAVKEFCEVNEREEELLLSTARPIVLLKKKKDFALEICGESDRIGALLPCNPLQILLLEETGPLVMTSGNRGGEPIIIHDEEMLKWMETGCPDMVLTHDREILTPLDDSIYQVNGRFVQLIRRARGLVPEPVELAEPLERDTFAAGGDLKAVFALGRGKMVYLSQHFGDLKEVACMRQREQSIARMENLLEISPKLLVGDMHPAYVSAQGTERKVQHHMAHAASVIAEHKLKGNVLGIVCDGTGYGTDGTIWGSEIFFSDDRLTGIEKMKRVGHFASVKLLGGDAGAKDADKTLFSYRMAAKERGLLTDQKSVCGEKEQSEEKKYSQEADRKLLEAAWKQNLNTVYSSSMGRLFDAVSALLDICHYNSYEGECAVLLEQAAHKGLAYINMQTEEGRNKIRKEMPVVQITEQDGVWIADSVKLLADLEELRSVYYGKQIYRQNADEILAYLFHHAVSAAMVSMADLCSREYHCSQTVLSGGSFINRILLTETAEGLEKCGQKVYTNEKVPCGDGGIALGQMWLVK